MKPIHTEKALNMNEPNESITLYGGPIKVLTDKMSFQGDVRIWYGWFPKPAPCFSGSLINISEYEIIKLGTQKSVKLNVEDSDLEEAILTRIVFKPPGHIEGIVKGSAVLGDKNLPAARVIFVLPNFLPFVGDINGPTDTFVLRYEDIQINISKKVDSRERNKKLQKLGGYLTVCDGEIISNGADVISYEEAINTCERLNWILSFINGSKTGPVLISGVQDTDIFWRDVSSAQVTSHRSRFSWAYEYAFDQLNTLWETMSSSWNEPEYQENIRVLLEWYIIANNKENDAKTSIVMVHSALELIYNWQIAERKHRENSDGMNADKRIRKLLRMLRESIHIPDTLQELNDYSKGEDGPRTFSNIRHAIVHPSLHNRKHLSPLSSNIFTESLDLGLLYLELSLLYILGFKGKFKDRTLYNRSHHFIRKVPWAD